MHGDFEHLIRRERAEPFDEVNIDHFWIDADLREWCFFYVDGVPWLANEDDADGRRHVIDGE